MSPSPLIPYSSCLPPLSLVHDIIINLLHSRTCRVTLHRRKRHSINVLPYPDLLCYLLALLSLNHLAYHIIAHACPPCAGCGAVVGACPGCSGCPGRAGCSICIARCRCASCTSS